MLATGNMRSCSSFEGNISTRETVSHRDIQTPRRELKFDAQGSIFDEIQGVWIADETLSRVIDICSQSKQKLSKREKIVNI